MESISSEKVTCKRRFSAGSYEVFNGFLECSLGIVRRFCWKSKCIVGRAIIFDKRKKCLATSFISQPALSRGFQKNTGLELWVLSIFKFSRNKKQIMINYTTTRCFIVYVDQRAVKQSWIETWAKKNPTFFLSHRCRIVDYPN